MSQRPDPSSFHVKREDVQPSGLYLASGMAGLMKRGSLRRASLPDGNGPIVEQIRAALRAWVSLSDTPGRNKPRR